RGAMVRDRLGRRPGAPSRGVERGAEMLARVAAAALAAVMDEHLLVERREDVVLLGERGRRFAPTARERPADRAGEPGASLRRATDHHGVGAGGGKRGGRVLGVLDVAVHNDRERAALLDRAHRTPVGPALAE